MRGITHYALGIFYRMAPESRILDWLFGFRGDLDKSVRHHKLALHKAPNVIEYHTEIGATYLCRYDRRDDPQDLVEAKKILNRCQTLTPKFKLSFISQNDCKRLLEKPALACGYSRDRQQQVSDEAFQKALKKHK